MGKGTRPSEAQEHGDTDQSTASLGATPRWAGPIRGPAISELISEAQAEVCGSVGSCVLDHSLGPCGGFWTLLSCTSLVS